MYVDLVNYGCVALHINYSELILEHVQHKFRIQVEGGLWYISKILQDVGVSSRGVNM